MPGQVEAPTRLDESWLDDPSVDGRSLLRILRVTFDPSADTALRPTGTYSLPSSRAGLPSGAIVVRSWYEVITTFTDGAIDSATISIGYATDDVAGIKAAVAISDGANPWDDGFVEGIQTGTAATFSNKTTAERLIDFTVGTAALTAGKLVLFLEYVVSDAG